MLLLKAENVKKRYGERTVLDIKELAVYANDRIGVVGANGAGKTTLLELLAGELEPEEGRIFRYGAVSYCRQFAGGGNPLGGVEQVAEEVPAEEGSDISRREARRWRVPEREAAARSGGEEMRQKLAEVFSGEQHVLFMDEPTANLDRDGIRMLTEQLKRAETFLCISHDRELLNQVCTEILEVADGKIKRYAGNYRAYEQQKEQERQKAEQDYEEYVREKERLNAVYQEKRRKADKMTKLPKNMSPREARLRDFLTISGRNSSGKQKSMNRAANNVKMRIEHMEEKEKPRQQASIHLNFSLTDPPENRRILEAKGLTFSYGSVPIFEDAAFSLANHKKIALVGPNGCGKTTLFRLLERAYAGQGSEGAGQIRIVPKAKFGFLAQDFSALNPAETVLENALADSVQQPSAVKSALAGLLFPPGTWGKRVAVLSGGERMRLAFAKLLVSAANVLLLDEPTNYLDLPSIRALEKQIQEYEGTVFFISHDQAFIRSTADEILWIEDQKIHTFGGTAEEFERSQKEQEKGKHPKKAGNGKPSSNKALGEPGPALGKEERLLLELRLAKLAGELARGHSEQEQQRLEAEYLGIARRLQQKN